MSTHFARIISLLTIFLFVGLTNGVAAGELHEAVRSGDAGRVKAALSSGADVNEIDLFGTPLHMAVAVGSLDITTILIDTGANIEAEADSSQKRGHPLHIAAYMNQPEIAALLLKNCADVNARDSEGATPLIVAAVNGSEPVAKILLESGADPLIENEAYHDTALHCAAAFNHPEIVKMLLDRGVNVNLRSGHGGETPLYYAMMDRRADVIKLLLESGADPTLTDNAGRLPTYSSPDPAIAKMLKDLQNKQ